MYCAVQSRLLLALALMAAFTCPAGADDVTLVHDKAFWSEYLEQIATLASQELGISVTESPFSPPERYKAFIQSAVASGDVPPVFSWWTGVMYEELVQTGRIAELDSLWDELVDSGDYTAETRALYTVNDHEYGVPLYLSRWVALYNKEHFMEAGIGVPRTWDDLINAAETLRKAGHTPFLATTEGGWRGFIWFQELMLRTNPDAYRGLHTGTVAYDSAPVRAVFEIWSDWYERGYFSDARSTEEVADFVRGKGSIYLIGDWAIGLVESAGLAPGKDFGAFLVPNMNPELAPAVISEAGPIVVSKEGYKNSDVIRTLRFFLSQEGAEAWGRASGNWIGNQKAAAPNVLIGEIDSVLSEGKAHTFQRWWEAVPSDIQGELVAELNRFMLDPTMKTAERVMRNMQYINEAYWADQ